MAYYREVIRGSPLIEHFLRWWRNHRPVEPLALVCTDQQELVPLQEIAAPYDVPVLHSPGRAELGLLRHACKTLNTAEIAVLQLTLPLLPAAFRAVGGVTIFIR